MPSNYTQGATYGDLVVYHQNPVFAKQTLKSVTPAVDLKVGDVINASGALFTSTDTVAYVVAEPALTTQQYVIVIGTGCVLRPEALSFGDATSSGAAKDLIVAAGNRFADENTVVNQ
ncbi:TPA: hypothetical protein JAN03_20230 [Citrobacter freundii]|nr:hypothetical protein [Citrobacter freundii]